MVSCPDITLNTCSRLQMILTASPHIPHLDGWRGLAIVAVLVGHFAGAGFGWLGEFGVMLFFVLSGRLMCQLLFIKQVPLTTFFFRRFSRILPAFWMFVLVVFSYSAFLRDSSFQPAMEELAATLFFLRTYLPGDTTILTRQWPIGHIWSLNVEEHSYLFLAAVALLCRHYGARRLAPVFLLASLCAALLFNLLYAVLPPNGVSPWHMRSEAASVGILAGASFWYLKEHFGAHLIERVPTLLPILGVGIAAVCVALYGHKHLDKTLAPLCLAFSVCCIDRFPVLVKKLLALALLRWFGVCSFSLYLWQQPFFLSTLTDGTSRPVALALALLAGAASFYLFEDPIRQAINKAWDERKRASVLAPLPQGDV
jgi:peptidoglycan/LPS O-acetylase OafA/YrhL